MAEQTSQDTQQSNYSDFTQQLGKTLVEQIERAQEAQVQALQQMRESLERALPNMGDIELPGNNLLPEPKAIAKANFALMEQLLEAQKSYTLGLLESLNPRREKSA